MPIANEKGFTGTMGRPQDRLAGGRTFKMMGRSRIGVVLGAAVVLALWVAAPAWAAPTRLSADPEPGAELH